MNSKELRKRYIEFFKTRGHKEVPSAPLVPENDPTTLFVSAGMQPMLPYLLGKPDPLGARIVDSQKCVRTADIDEVGDNRHQTFFEMLGNWSFGDYFKKEQLPWIFEFLIEIVGLDPRRLYVTVFSGDEKYNLPQDKESAEIWKELFSKQNIDTKDVVLGSLEDAAEVGMQEGRVFYYDQKKNWWSRFSSIDDMPTGEPGGPNSEMFYEFPEIEHDPRCGKNCHPNCDCGRFLEIGNSVFMQYKKSSEGLLQELPDKSVDYGGGLERLVMVQNNQPDVFRTDLFWPIIKKIEEVSQKRYDEHKRDFRVIADHVKAAIFINSDGINPSNQGQGYILRRLIRRAVRKGKALKINHPFIHLLIQDVVNIYSDQYPELKDKLPSITATLVDEEKRFQIPLDGIEQFRIDLEAAQKHNLNKKIKNVPLFSSPGTVSGEYVYELFQTYGVPPDLSQEVIIEMGLKFNQAEFDEAFQKHRDLSRTASAGMFKGGLADHSEEVTKYHTATHLLHAALRQILGTHVAQKGSNLTAERLRFDFSQPEKLTEEQIKKIEDLVNEKIKENLVVTSEVINKEEALKSGALAFFGEKYGDKVTVYTIGDPSTPSGRSGFPFSREICGGPHVSSTENLGHFKIIKEESAGAGIRRIYATLT